MARRVAIVAPERNTSADFLKARDRRGFSHRLGIQRTALRAAADAER